MLGHSQTQGAAVPASSRRATGPYCAAAGGALRDAAWRKAKVHLDDPVDVERHDYSAPHSLTGKVRLCASTVEDFPSPIARRRAPPVIDQRRLTTSWHAGPGAIVPSRSRDKLLARAEAIGPATAGVCRHKGHTRVHPEHALRACLGILRSAQDLSPAQHEAAASGRCRSRAPAAAPSAC